MKILALATTFPFSGRTGCTIVARETLARLAPRHEVHLRCAAPLRGDSADAPVSVASVEVYDLRARPHFMSAVRGLMQPAFPMQFSPIRSVLMMRGVSSTLACGGFDGVLAFGLAAIQYCPSLWLSRMVANVEDPLTLRAVGVLRLEFPSVRQRALAVAEYAAGRLYERQVLGRVGRVLVLSEADADATRRGEGRSHFHAVQYGVQCQDDSEIVEDDSRVEGMIVISGNMFHPANVDGVLGFLRDVLSQVLAAAPSAVLFVVGAEPDRRIRRAALRFGDSVRVTGTVPCVSDYLKRARVAVCPVRLRIGVQTKTLEALSWGTPVVTTEEGNSGIKGVSGVDLRVARDAREMADGIVDLLAGRDWKLLSKGGRRMVRERFTWSESVAQTEHHLEAVANRRRPT